LYKGTRLLNYNYEEMTHYNTVYFKPVEDDLSGVEDIENIEKKKKKNLKKFF